MDVNAFLTELPFLHYTPLTRAIKLSREDEVRSLISRGADVNKKDKYGWSPLMVAVYVRNHVIVKILLDNGADPDWGQLLSTAIEQGMTEIASLLRAVGAAERIKTRRRRRD